MYRDSHTRSGGWGGRDVALHAAGIVSFARQGRRKSVYVRRHGHPASVPAGLRARSGETPPGGAGGGRSAGDGPGGRVQHRQTQLPGVAENSLESRRAAARRSSRWEPLAHSAPGSRERPFLAARAGLGGAGNALRAFRAERSERVSFRVMIVDDSPVMRAFIRRIILLSGMDSADFLEASNGHEALDLLRNEWVDVVLTDINMPSMDGEELVRRLAADDMLKTMSVVIVSTDGTESRMQQMLALGARGYVKKP